MTKIYSLLLILIATAFTTVNAQDAPVLTFDIPAQNNIRYNRFLMNPAFSFVRENNRYISLYHRSQWIQFDDSPKVYMLSYNGRFAENAGFGIGIYQQNIGVISSFGGVGNYAYNIRLNKDMNLTLGLNAAFYSSGVNKNRTITETPDPVLMAMRNNSLASLKPGINFSYRGFDIGAYAENFVEYDFKSNQMVTDYSDKTYSGHIMYTSIMNNMPNLLQGGLFRVGIGGQMDDSGFNLNGNILVDFPRIGWLQTSLHDYYGVGVGAGFHLTKRLSLGYVFERTVKEGLVNLGPTHELTMIFRINDAPIGPVENNRSPLDQAEQDVEFTDDEDVAKRQEDFDKEAELEKLRMELDDESMHLLDALVKQDSLVTIQKDDFEKKVKNLREYAQREQQAKKEGETVRFNPDTGEVEVINPAADSIQALNKQKEEKEIKEYYASKTNKPRKSLKKVNKIKVDGLESGYYIIANVFSTQENTDKFIKQLRSKGFKDAGYFINSTNGFRYVYLKRHNSWRDAMISYYSNMDNTYFDTIWIGSVNSN
jgi:type IX secretion system PorP/SprF family membrane protein